VGVVGHGVAAGHAADASLAGASTEHSGYLVKRRLVRAALAGMAALRAVDPTARFLHVEPLVHVSAPPDRPELAPLAQQIRDYQWQALDLLSGRLEPELGGHEAALDWLGFNHYHSSQWEAVSEARLSWHRRDPRRQPLSELLQEAWLRYRRPLLLAETGHVGMGRAAWLHDVAGEALRARAMGLPLRGICLYPLLDRPDWQDPARWHRCGLWQVHGGAASLSSSSSSSPSLSPAPAPDAAQGTARQARPGSRHLVHAYASALKSWECLPAPPPARPRRLLVLLPSRWEALDAGLQLLLRRLSGEAPACPALRQVAARSGGFAVVLVEPPRGQHARPRLRRYRLGPALELLVAHGLPGAGAWPQGIAALPLVNAELEPGPAGGTLLWLMRWPRESPGTAWLRSALQPDALVLQPDAQDAGPDGATSLGRADLLLCESDAQYSHYSNHHSRVLRLPAGLPPRWLRPPPPGSYEALEAQRLLEEIPFFAPDLRVHLLPDWETLPYDHFSPHGDLVSERLATLWQIRNGECDVVIAPVTTALTRLSPVSFLLGRTFWLKQKQRLDVDRLRADMVTAGYQHVSQVVAPGEFSLRGGLVDLFPMGSALPYRIDLFDDEIETLATFDVDTQRTLYPVPEIRLLPAREFPLDEQGQARFRQNFRERFEGDPSKSRIYKGVSKGIAPAGIEYYLPLFFEHTATLFDYLPADSLLLSFEDTAQSVARQWDEIGERYEQLRHDVERPQVPPAQLFLSAEEIDAALTAHPRCRLLATAAADAATADNFALQAPPRLSLPARAAAARLAARLPRPFHGPRPAGGRDARRCRPRRSLGSRSGADRA